MSFFPEKGRESYLYRLSYLFPVAIFGERSPGDLGILFFILNVEKYSYSFASFLHKLFYNSRKHAVKSGNPDKSPISFIRLLPPFVA